MHICHQQHWFTIFLTFFFIHSTGQPSKDPKNVDFAPSIFEIDPNVAAKQLERKVKQQKRQQKQQLHLADNQKPDGEPTFDPASAAKAVVASLNLNIGSNDPREDPKIPPASSQRVIDQPTTFVKWDFTKSTSFVESRQPPQLKLIDPSSAAHSMPTFAEPPRTLPTSNPVVNLPAYLNIPYYGPRDSMFHGAPFLSIAGMPFGGGVPSNVHLPSNAYGFDAQVPLPPALGPLNPIVIQPDLMPLPMPRPVNAPPPLIRGQIPPQHPTQPFPRMPRLHLQGTRPAARPPPPSTEPSKEPPSSVNLPATGKGGQELPIRSVQMDLPDCTINLQYARTFSPEAKDEDEKETEMLEESAKLLRSRASSLRAFYYLMMGTSSCPQSTISGNS